jgi:hypothetical protein
MTPRHLHRSVTARRIAVVLSATAALTLAAIPRGQTYGATCEGSLASPAPPGGPAWDASFEPGPVTIDASGWAGPAGLVIIGSEGSDTLIGSPFDDKICGRGGNDYIDGGAGADTINGGFGSDTIFGGPGADFKIDGSWGNDYINAVDTPAVADVVIVGGLGFNSCFLDGLDPPNATGCGLVDLNPFPLPFP